MSLRKLFLLALPFAVLTACGDKEEDSGTAGDDHDHDHEDGEDHDH